MNFFSLILFVIAAVIFGLTFVMMTEVRATRLGRSPIALGLAVLTVGFIVQFCASTHPIHF